MIRKAMKKTTNPIRNPFNLLVIKLFFCDEGILQRSQCHFQNKESGYSAF
jgi:hypothetical protein